MNHRLSLLSLVGAALVLSAIPYLHVPLTWFETLFHETSHALAAWVTGGHVQRLELHLDGSGLTWTAGGWSPLISWAGYAGAIAWGSGLYLLATAVSDRTARHVVWGLLLAGLLETVTWLAWGWSSWAIMATLMGVLAMLLWRPAARVARPLLRFIGLYVLLSGIRSPTYLLGMGEGDNDARALAHLLWVPAVVWVALWVILGLAALGMLYRRAGRADRRLSEREP
jgi:hypothetical protein